jgi:RND family efflux transporter MFP subunit
MKIQTKRKKLMLAISMVFGVTAVQPPTVASVTVAIDQDDHSSAPLVIEGLIEPWRDLRIGVGVEGLIDKVFVERGQLVKAGDPVARLESSVEEAQVALSRATSEMRSGLESAQVRERLATLRAKRNRQLFDEGAVTFEELETVLAEEELAKLAVRDVEETLLRAGLDLRIAEAMLARRAVTSPVDGVVVERFLSPGELVNRAGPGEVVRIAQTHPLKIDVIAPLSLFRRVKAGQSALVSPEEPIGGVYEAKVRVVDPLVDAASGTFRIRLELPNEDLSVPSGVRCRVQFQD